MVARKYLGTKYQKGGKIKLGEKIKTRVGALSHSGKQAIKVAAIGTGASVAVPAAIVSAVKAGTVAAATSAISAPTRVIQGSIKTPWQLGKLGFQKIKEIKARRKLTAAGMHNYENLKARVSKRKTKLNTLRDQKTKLNQAKFAQNLEGTGSRLSSWWKGKQIARKEKAIANAEARLGQSLKRKGERTQTTIASETQNISQKAAKFLEGLNTTKQRQMTAYNQSLQTKREGRAAPIQAKITELRANTHETRTQYNAAKTKKANAQAALNASKTDLAKFTRLEPTDFLNGKVTVNIDGTEYTREEAIKKSKDLRNTIKDQTKKLSIADTEFKKSKKQVNALDAEVAKLTKQKDEYMAQGRTGEQLYGSFQRRKARVQQTKKNLAQTAQQLTGISTIKNIARATGASFKQDLGLAQSAVKRLTGKQIGNPINTSFGTLGKAVGKSLISSGTNIKSRYTAMKAGVEPLTLKVETWWRANINKFSKQGKLLKKMEGDLNNDGKLQTEALEIKRAYDDLQNGELVPPELRAKHQALINKREIMRNFANLIATNRSKTPDPNIAIKATSDVAKAASKLGITLPLTDLTQLDTDIENVENKFNDAKGSIKNQYLELYNHLKSIKRWNDSSDFSKRADNLNEKLNGLLTEIEVLPEFKPVSVKESTA